MKMNVDQLRTFVIIVESGGVHRAVARLNLSQPAASRQINALEATLGVPLFDRIGRRLKLTSEGEALLRLSRSLLGEVQTFHERAAALKKGETGVLRVAATPQVIENTLANFLGAFGADTRVSRFSWSRKEESRCPAVLSSVMCTSLSWRWMTTVFGLGCSIQ